MTSIPVPGTDSDAFDQALSRGRVLVVLGLTLFVALALYYFVGAEQGATSIFGSSGGDIHEWVHDARHLLGFPCH